MERSIETLHHCWFNHSLKTPWDSVYVSICYKGMCGGLVDILYYQVLDDAQEFPGSIIIGYFKQWNRSFPVYVTRKFACYTNNRA